MCKWFGSDPRTINEVPKDGARRAGPSGARLVLTGSGTKGSSRGRPPPLGGEPLSRAAHGLSLTVRKGGTNVVLQPH